MGTAFLKVLGAAALLAAVSMPASAATIPVANGNFEAESVFPNGGSVQGRYSLTLPSWTFSGTAGTWNIGGGSTSFNSIPAAVGQDVGFVLNGGTISQLLGVNFTAGTIYELSALFGHRLEQPLTGTFGFYAGSINNIIASATINDPGLGNFGTQSLTLTLAQIAGVLGQPIGIFIQAAPNAHVIVDNVAVQTVVPVPAAWLIFASGAGILGLRRKKKLAA